MTLVTLNSCYVQPTLTFHQGFNDTAFQISSRDEEADQKIIRDALDSTKVGCSFIEMQSIDTDVLIVLLA